MSREACIGLVGDFDESVTAHRAIPIALQLAQEVSGVVVRYEWIATDSILDESHVNTFDGLWCVPASPYRSEDGALIAIRFARENKIPFLGTCGGFQHLILEYARKVLGWRDAEHGETNPASTRAVIAPLACSLVEATNTVRFVAGSRIASIYNTPQSSEGYRCNYGLNTKFQSALVSGPLRAVAFDDTGEVRAVELDAHPFYVGTLFQPERAALAGLVPPLVREFVRQASVTASRSR